MTYSNIIESGCHQLRWSQPDDYIKKSVENTAYLSTVYASRNREKLFVSKRTVEGYRIKILETMTVKNATGIVVFALKHNFIKESEIL